MTMNRYGFRQAIVRAMFFEMPPIADVSEACRHFRVPLADMRGLAPISLLDRGGLEDRVSRYRAVDPFGFPRSAVAPFRARTDVM